MKEPKVKLECLRLLVTLKLDPARMQMIVGFVDTYLELNAQEQRQFAKALAVEPPKEKKKVMQIAGNWMKEGWEKGLLEGRQEGRREEALRFTLRLLHRRVENLPLAVQKRVEKLPLEKLEALGEALLDFESLADLRAWLKANG